MRVSTPARPLFRATAVSNQIAKAPAKGAGVPNYREALRKEGFSLYPDSSFGKEAKLILLWKVANLFLLLSGQK